MAAFTLSRSPASAPQTSGGPPSSSTFLVAALLPPAVLAFLFLIRLAKKLLPATGPRQASFRSRGAQAAGPLPTISKETVPVCVGPAAAAPRVVEQRDIEVRVLAFARGVQLATSISTSKEAVIVIDALSSGDSLLRRARLCLGEDLGEVLELEGSGGRKLDLYRPLRSQGFVGGETLIGRSSASEEPTAPLRGGERKRQ
ncbi:unnamed protein product, partial [Polarella glacialis]